MKRKKYPTYILSILAVMLIIYTIIFQPSAIGDIIASLVFMALLYFFDRKYNLPVEAFIFIVIAILLNPLGVFGLYSKFVFYDIGYDKVIHLFAGFAVAYGLFHVIPTKDKKSVYALIILILLGLGVLIEVSEFIGTRYFGIERGGIFAIGDALPEIRSDLQTYDIYFDFIFNLVGAIIGVIAGILKNNKLPCKQLRKHYKKYH